METVNLLLDPGVDTMFDFAAYVRISVVGFLLAGVARVPGCTVTHDIELVIGGMAAEQLSRWAFPMVEFLVEFEAGHAHLLRPVMGMLGEPFQHRCDGYQKQRVASRHQHFRMEIVDHPCTPEDSTISVKRLSSGCSAAVSGATWRTPSHSR